MGINRTILKPLEGGKAIRTCLSSNSLMLSQNGFGPCAYSYAIQPSPIGLPEKFLDSYMHSA